jgi:hypothetical protein
MKTEKRRKERIRRGEGEKEQRRWVEYINGENEEEEDKKRRKRKIRRMDRI